MPSCKYCGSTENVIEYWCGHNYMCDDCAAEWTKDWVVVSHCSACDSNRCRYYKYNYYEEDKLGW